MAEHLMIDPDDLTRSMVVITTADKMIELVKGGDFGNLGATIKCLYSFLKEEWKTDTDLIKFAFPMQPITDEQMELINGWNFKDDATRYLIRTGGWAVKDSGGISSEEWAGIVSLGSLGGSDQVYFQQIPAGPATNIELTGVVNQAVKVYDTTTPIATAHRARNASNVATLGTGTAHGLLVGSWVIIAGVGGTGYNGTYQVTSVADTTHFTYANTGSEETETVDVGGTTIQDYRKCFSLFVREYAKTYGMSQLSDIGVSTMTYQVYRFPLANATDLKIIANDTAVDGDAPYTSMSLTWYAAAQQRSIGGTNRDFHAIIDGNAGTAEQIYTFVQRQLRKDTDIDAGSGSKIGKVTSGLLQFTGDSLKALLYTTGQGTYIDDFQSVDTNRLSFIDDTNTERTFPYVASLTLQFGDNLVNDSNSIYKVFFTNDDAGTNLGYDFGTADAIIVEDASDADMAGTISGASISHSFNFDSNDQRGAGSEGDVAPITVVAIGLNTAQYIKATGTIARSIANVISLVAPLERNYSNPT